MPCSPLQEIRLLTHDDFLNDPAAGKGLGHLGRVNAELDLWTVAGQKIALKTGRDVEHQGVETGIHAGDPMRPASRFDALPSAISEIRLPSPDIGFTRTA